MFSLIIRVHCLIILIFYEFNMLQHRVHKCLMIEQTPLVTLKGHREAVSAVCWPNPSSIVTASWDHTIRCWDPETAGLTSELCGNKSFFDLHISPLTGLYITASADRHVRLYDPRSTGIDLL